MYFKSKVISLSILVVTSVLLSRGLFFFFDDPEGPNLLVVMVGAFVTSVPSSLFYFSNSSIKGLKRLLVAVAAQVLAVIALYFILQIV
jgi:hypothetical protein